MMFLVAAVLLLSPSLKAQETASDAGFTPYSVFGIGDLVHQGTTYNHSMGGVGIADRNFRTINIINPAAVTEREMKSFMFDFGLKNRNLVYQGNAATAIGSKATGPLKSANNTFNIDHIVASFPITEKNSAFKVGIMPYSNVGYNFTAHEQDDELTAEMGDIAYKKIGQGSLYQVFLGAGVTLWDRLSVGVDGNYYFGDMEHYSNAYFTTKTNYRTIKSGWSYIMSAFGAKFGLQYAQPIGQGSKLTVGATYTMAAKIKGYENRYAYADEDTVTNIKTKIEGYSIPAELGVGISFTTADAWRFNFDYTRQDWTSVIFEGSPGVDFKTGTAQAFRFGAEWTPNRYDVRYFFRRMSYRAGFYRENSYLMLNGHHVSATGFTAGVSIPIPRLYNSIDLGVELGQRGTMEDNLIRERYCIVHLTFSLHDLWFLKNLYQ